MRKSNALPGLDLLVGFEAAARHLSFTKAGAELYRTQSAVSRQIKELEDQLGVALFQRRHRALALTEPGHQLYATAAQVLATMRSATERLRRQSGRRRGVELMARLGQRERACRTWSATGSTWRSGMARPRSPAPTRCGSSVSGCSRSAARSFCATQCGR